MNLVNILSVFFIHSFFFVDSIVLAANIFYDVKMKKAQFMLYFFVPHRIKYAQKVADNYGL